MHKSGYYTRGYLDRLSISCLIISNYRNMNNVEDGVYFSVLLMLSRLNQDMFLCLAALFSLGGIDNSRSFSMGVEGDATFNNSVPDNSKRIQEGKLIDLDSPPVDSSAKAAEVTGNGYENGQDSLNELLFTLKRQVVTKQQMLVGAERVWQEL